MRTFFSLTLLVLFSSVIYSQDREKALKNVEEYIKSKSTNSFNYKRVKVHEFFEQSSADEIAKSLNITETIKYSLSLSYKLGDSLIDFSYFHLDKEFKVLGVSSKDEMMAMPSDLEDKILAMLMNPDIGNPLDSSETTSKLVMKNKKFKKEILYENDGLLFIYEYKAFSAMIDEKYLNLNILFPTGSPQKGFGVALRNYLDTCRSNSLSLNSFVNSYKTDDTESLLSYLNYEMRQLNFTSGKMKIADAKTGKELQNLVVKKKTIHFPKFTRLVTRYLTEDESLEVDKFQFDEYGVQ